MTQLFWQADLIVGGFTGFYRQGTLILDLRKSAWQYLITWGTFDLGLVIMGWLFILLDLVEDDALHSMAKVKMGWFYQGKKDEKGQTLCGSVLIQTCPPVIKRGWLENDQLQTSI